VYDSVRRELLYSIFFEFGIPVISFRLIRMCLNKTCSKAHIGKNLFDEFPVLSGLKYFITTVFQFHPEYAISKVEES